MTKNKGKKITEASESLDHEKADCLVEQESETAAFTKKRMSAGGDLKQNVKVELSDFLSTVIRDGILTLEERGLKKSAADFIQFCLEGIQESQVVAWVERETPLEWRVNECLKDESKAKFIRRLFDLDPARGSQTLKALDQVFEKKEKVGRLVQKKKRKPAVLFSPAPIEPLPEVNSSPEDSPSH